VLDDVPRLVPAERDDVLAILMFGNEHVQQKHGAARKHRSRQSSYALRCSGHAAH
jgi:hypothetical protein